MIGIDIAQVDFFLLGFRHQHVGAAGHVDCHRVKEMLRQHGEAQITHSLDKNLHEALRAFCSFLNALGAIVDGKHGCGDREQHLCCADVACRFFAADVLFTGLQRHAQRPVSLRIH